MSAEYFRLIHCWMVIYYVKVCVQDSNLVKYGCFDVVLCCFVKISLSGYY